MMQIKNKLPKRTDLPPEFRPLFDAARTALKRAGYCEFTYFAAVEGKVAAIFGFPASSGYAYVQSSAQGVVAYVLPTLAAATEMVEEDYPNNSTYVGLDVLAGLKGPHTSCSTT